MRVEETLALTPALSPRRGRTPHSSREFSRPLVRHRFMETYVGCHERKAFKSASEASDRHRRPARIGLTLDHRPDIELRVLPEDHLRNAPLMGSVCRWPESGRAARQMVVSLNNNQPNTSYEPAPRNTSGSRLRRSRFVLADLVRTASRSH